MSGKGIGGHQKAYKGATDNWLTPPEIIQSLGPFGLDPCCPAVMPWPTARKMLRHPKVDGLREYWPPGSLAWVNPPYGPQTGRWLQKLAKHGSGIALIFARTETETFHKWVWGKADGVFFFRGRLHFHLPSGERAAHNAGGPSCLAAYGLKACRR